MTKPPDMIGGARVVRWSPIDERHNPTGSCAQIVGDELQGPAACVAICQYEGDQTYYLFGCDTNWNTVTDSWHETLDEALEQAEFEYEGVSTTWTIA